MSFVTRRSQLIAKYDAQEADRGSYIVSTKPYHSTLSVPFEVVGWDAANQFAYAICRKGTVLDFFSYGIGDSQTFGTNTRKANDADTNISKAKQTNGNADFVVEGLSLQVGAVRQADGLGGVAGTVTYPLPADPDALAAIVGARPVADPGSIFLVPQAYSPFNLESVLMQAILRSGSVQLNWDEDRTEKIGHLLSLPQGGGGSQLRSNGMPMANNVFRVEEGYLWARVGEQDSELVVRVTIQEAIVIPITLNDSPADSTLVTAPVGIFLDMSLKLHGFEFKYPSRN